MTWTYAGTPGDGSAAEYRDAVRFLTGDIVTTNQQITDEEIAYLLDENNNDAYLAAAQACEAIAGRYASSATTTKTVGKLSLSRDYSAQSARWSERAAQLRLSAMYRHPPTPRTYEDDDGNLYGRESRLSIGMHDSEA